MNEKRIVFLISMVFFFSLVLVGRLAQLQLVQGETHRNRAENIRTDKVLIQPQRGNIVDRKGQIIAREDALWEVHMNYWLFTEPSTVLERLNYQGIEKSGFTKAEFDEIIRICSEIVKYRSRKKVSKSRSFFETWPSRQNELLRREVRNSLKTLSQLLRVPYEELITKLECVEDEINREVDEKSDRVTEKYYRICKLGASSGYWEDLARDERRQGIAKEERRFQDNPLIIVDQIDRDTLETLQELDWMFPGIEGVPVLKRSYPFGETACHLIGYMREIQRIGFEFDETEEFDLTKSPYFKKAVEKAIDDIGEEFILKYFRSKEDFAQRFRHDLFRTSVGVTGIESKFNDRLSGKYGNTIVERDVKGRTRKIIDDISPEPANELMLTIDMDLQKACEDALKWYFENGRPEKCPGAAVIMNVNTGEILALASYPTFDLQKLMGNSEADADYRSKLYSNEFAGKPLINRALHATVPPGSIFKVVVAAAAMNKWNPILSGPEYWYGKDFGTIWDIAREKYHQKKGFTDHAAYGKLNLEQAIEVSCNSFFHEMAYKLGYETLWAWANTFGFGEKTGAELPEYTAWRKKADGTEYNWFYPTTPSNPLEVALNGIGQGRLRVTPIQVARFMSAVATKGYLPTPTILLENAGHVDKKYIDGVPASGWDAIHRGMIGCVDGSRGTARHVKGLSRLKIAAKTGTAQTSRKLDGKELNFSWFAGFAPYDKPQFAFAVYIEETYDSGANSAGNVTSQIMTYLSEMEEFKHYFE